MFAIHSAVSLYFRNLAHTSAPQFENQCDIKPISLFDSDHINKE